MRRVLLAAGAGVLVTALVALAGASGLISGVAALVLALVLVALVPTTRILTARLAINGSIAMGFLPVLYWIPFPTAGSLGRVDAVVALLCGLVVALAVVRGRRVLPVPGRGWWVPLGALVFAVLFFQPLLRQRAATASLAMLTGAFGNDNVAHFDMFEMIRRQGGEPPVWGAAPDGSAFAYVSYPQHFHALAAIAAELWHGVTPSSDEVGLYGAATAIVLIGTLVTLTAAIAAATRLSLLAVLPAAFAASTLFLGVGASNLVYGFPGFDVAIVGTVIAVLLAMSPERRVGARLVAVAALTVLVAHGWALLAPLAGLALLTMIFRLPSRKVRGHPASIIRLAVIAAAVVVGGLYALVLVLQATVSSGSPEDALGTPGGLAPIPIPAGIAIVLALIGVAIAGVGSVRDLRSARWAFFAVPGLVGVLGLAEGVGLLAVQFLHAHSVSYFQYKYFNALTMISVILLAVVVTAWAAGGLRTLSWRSPRVVTVTALLTIAVIIFAGTPGLAFRHGLKTAAVATGASTRLLAASQVMERAACVRPFYLAAVPGDLRPGESNQWAMALSGSWTEGGSAITSALFIDDVTPTADQAATVLSGILSDDPARCAVVAPQVLAGLPASVRNDYGHRILTWG